MASAIGMRAGCMAWPVVRSLQPAVNLTNIFAYFWLVSWSVFYLFQSHSYQKFVDFHVKSVLMHLILSLLTLVLNC